VALARLVWADLAARDRRPKQQKLERLAVDETVLVETQVRYLRPVLPIHAMFAALLPKVLSVLAWRAARQLIKAPET
jgi:hypothetical protein